MGRTGRSCVTVGRRWKPVGQGSIRRPGRGRRDLLGRGRRQGMRSGSYGGVYRGWMDRIDRSVLFTGAVGGSNETIDPRLGRPSLGSYGSPGIRGRAAGPRRVGAADRAVRGHSRAGERERSVGAVLRSLLGHPHARVSRSRHRCGLSGSRRPLARPLARDHCAHPPHRPSRAGRPLLHRPFAALRGRAGRLRPGPAAPRDADRGGAVPRSGAVP